MGELTRQDLLDAADACEIYAERLAERVERHFAGGEEGRGDNLQPEVDRFRELTRKLRAADRPKEGDADGE